MQVSSQQPLKAVNKNRKVRKVYFVFIDCYVGLDLILVIYSTTDIFNRFSVRTDLIEQRD